MSIDRTTYLVCYAYLATLTIASLACATQNNKSNQLSGNTERESEQQQPSVWHMHVPERTFGLPTMMAYGLKSVNFFCFVSFDFNKHYLQTVIIIYLIFFFSRFYFIFEYLF